MRVIYLVREHEAGGSYHAEGAVGPRVSIPRSQLDAIAGRSIGDRGVLVAGLHDGEPAFVLRAQDASAAALVALWGVTNPQLSEGRRDEFEGDVQAWNEWRAAHPELVKQAD